MSEAKFTPGPWVITDTCSNYIFDVVRIGSKDIDCGTEANAHLIAAAPEMYQELDSLLAAINMGTGQNGPFLRYSKSIERLLSRARGEQP